MLVFKTNYVTILFYCTQHDCTILSNTILGIVNHENELSQVDYEANVSYACFLDA